MNRTIRSFAVVGIFCAGIYEIGRGIRVVVDWLDR